MPNTILTSTQPSQFFWFILTLPDSSCWIIIENNVYDVTEFLSVRPSLCILVRSFTNPTLEEHPGGAKIILKYAGKDATAVYEPIHPPDALEKHLQPLQHLGPLDSMATSKVIEQQQTRKKTIDELRVEEAVKRKPPLSRILSLTDMEVTTLSRFYPFGFLKRLSGRCKAGTVLQGLGVLLLRLG